MNYSRLRKAARTRSNEVSNALSVTIAEVQAFASDAIRAEFDELIRTGKIPITANFTVFRDGWQGKGQTHGITGYVQRGCRCKICSRAHSTYRAQKYEQNKTNKLVITTVEVIRDRMMAAGISQNLIDSITAVTV